MAGHFLAVGYAISASKTGTTNLTGTTNITWFLLILAAAAGARFSWLAPIGILVLFLLMHATAAHDVNAIGAALPWLVVALAALLVGWQLGGRTILRHVGEREYRNRLSAAKGINSIWQRWPRDAE